MELKIDDLVRVYELTGWWKVVSIIGDSVLVKQNNIHRTIHRLDIEDHRRASDG